MDSMQSLSKFQRVSQKWKKIILKFIRYYKESQIAKIILRKEIKLENSCLPTSKLTTKLQYDTGLDQRNRMETLHKWQKKCLQEYQNHSMVERTVFSINDAGKTRYPHNLFTSLPYTINKY
jgi:hypothetical protein